MKGLAIYFLFHDIFSLIACGDSKLWGSIAKSRIDSERKYYNTINATQLRSSVSQNELNTKNVPTLFIPLAPALHKNLSKFSVSRHKRSSSSKPQVPSTTMTSQLTIPEITTNINELHANKTLFLEEFHNSLPKKNEMTMSTLPHNKSKIMKDNGPAKCSNKLSRNESKVSKTSNGISQESKSIISTTGYKSSDVGEPRVVTTLVVFNALLLDLIIITLVSPVIGGTFLVGIVLFCIFCL